MLDYTTTISLSPLTLTLTFTLTVADTRGLAHVVFSCKFSFKFILLRLTSYVSYQLPAQELADTVRGPVAQSRHQRGRDARRTHQSPQINLLKPRIAAGLGTKASAAEAGAWWCCSGQHMCGM